jgi:hypothetical protein
MIPEKHPAIVLKDVSYPHLQQMLQYIYVGTCSISQEDTEEFKKVLESLKIPFEEDNETEHDESDRESGSEDFSGLHDEEMEADDAELELPPWNNVKVKEEPADSPSSATSETPRGSRTDSQQPHHAESSTTYGDSAVVRYKCVTDGKISMEKVVPSKKIQKYMNDHPGTCPFCEKLFKTAKHRNEHVKYCFQNPNRVVSVCPLCNKNVCDPYYLRKHIKNVHGALSLHKLRNSQI